MVLDIRSILIIFGLNPLAIEFVKTSYEYNWLSPFEDIKSPFLLNLTIEASLPWVMLLIIPYRQIASKGGMGVRSQLNLRIKAEIYILCITLVL